MPKKQINGFSIFMQDILPELKREGRVFPNGLADVVPVASPRWKALSEQEKQRYNDIAKAEKKKGTKTGNVKRHDCEGNIIGQAKDIDVSIAKRRQKEYKFAFSRWPLGKKMLKQKFNLIKFEHLCRLSDGQYYPLEIGLVQFTMEKGIVKTLHRFIKPPPIPLGYQFHCNARRDDYHKIPFQNPDFRFDDNLQGLWIQLENFVNPDGLEDEYAPLYTLSNDSDCTESCMEWLHQHARVGRANRLAKIHILDGLFSDLYEKAKVDEEIESENRIGAISTSTALEMLTASQFDYESPMFCDWHRSDEADDTIHCALAAVNRFVAHMSDALAKIYGFKLTNKHILSDSSSTPGYQVLAPPPDPFAEPPSVHPYSNFRSSSPPTNSSVNGDFGRGDAFRERTDRSSGFGGQDVRYPQHPPVCFQVDQPDSDYSGSDDYYCGPSKGPSHDINDEEDFPSLGGTTSAPVVKRNSPAAVLKQNIAPQPTNKPAEVRNPRTVPKAMLQSSGSVTPVSALSEQESLNNGMNSMRLDNSHTTAPSLSSQTPSQDPSYSASGVWNSQNSLLAGRGRASISDTQNPLNNFVGIGRGGLHRPQNSVTSQDRPVGRGRGVWKPGASSSGFTPT